MSAIGPKADMDLCAANVRFWGQSGHDVLRRTCRLLTQSGHRKTAQSTNEPQPWRCSAWELAQILLLDGSDPAHIEKTYIGL